MRERNALGKEERKLPPLKIICNFFVHLVPECTLLVPQDWSAEKGLQYWAKECLETSWFGTLQIQVRKQLTAVVQTLDSAIHRINHYPVDKYEGNQLRYPLNRFLSCG